MISLTTPVFTAAIGRFAFGEPLPEGTVPTLLCGLFGSALAIWGGSDTSSIAGDGGSDASDSDTGSSRSSRSSIGDGDGAAPTASDSHVWLGIVLAFVSTIALAMYQHVVKLTKGIFSEHFILALNYAVVLVPCTCILALRQAQGESDLFGALGALGALQWSYLVAFAVVVYLGANLAQQVAIRSLGPTLVSSVMPLRLVSSVVGSYVVLDEGITSVAEAAGLLLVALAAAVYLGHRVYKSRQRRPTRADLGLARSDDPQPEPPQATPPPAPAASTELALRRARDEDA